MAPFLLALALCLGMVALVPLMVLAATGSWRHAGLALKQYTFIVAGFVVFGGTVGAWAALAGML